jgi:glycosyltransferase involved in cell wall biosynthesis
MLLQNAMSAPAPIISVIVVCRNPGDRLPAALASVWAQQGPAVELVVIDGASTDGSREWLETQRARIGVLVSEPDGGIYDAMNKGVARATGEWILFLGADDRLADPAALVRLLPTLAMSDAGVITGEARFDDGRRYPAAPVTAAIRRNFLHHQATFYRRRLFAAGGGFDTTLRLMADYDFNLRLLHGGVQFEIVTGLLAECASGGASDAGTWLGYREEMTVRHRYFPAWRCWPWDAGSVLRFLRKRLLRARS